MWVPAIFDTANNRRVLKMSRQVGKSSSGTAEETTRCVLWDHFNVLYVAPEQDQARKYSQDKVKPTIKNSPIINRMMGTYDNVHEKEFANGSKLYMKYAKHNPDSCRGITCDMVHYDEVQDMDLDDIAPIIDESLFTSSWKLRLYTGTPKSFENPIERKLWAKSDKREWLMRCSHHSPAKWINVGIRNIGKHGPICHHCGNLLDVDDGRWVRHNKNGDIAGFHVNQLHCKISHADLKDGKWIPNQDSWDEIINKLEEYPRGQFLNEVLGESADTSDKPLTEAMLANTSLPEIRIMPEPTARMMKTPRFAGIDWGHGEAATVLAIGQFNPEDPSRFCYVYFQKWEGSDTSPAICIPEIMAALKKYKVARVHCDYGGGFGMNHLLHEQYGKNKVTTNYWSNSATSADQTWSVKDSIPRLTLNKSNKIANYIQLIRRQKIQFPNWDDFCPKYSDDFLNIRREEDRNENIKYVKAGNDDGLHAALYAYVIAVAASHSNGL